MFCHVELQVFNSETRVRKKSYEEKITCNIKINDTI